MIVFLRHGRLVNDVLERPVVSLNWIGRCQWHALFALSDEPRVLLSTQYLGCLAMCAWSQSSVETVLASTTPVIAVGHHDQLMSVLQQVPGHTIEPHMLGPFCGFVLHPGANGPTVEVLM